MRIFTQVTLLALVAVALVGATQSAEESPTISFRRHQLDPAFRSEGVAVADFNRDGHLDIAAGNVYYAGPDWKMQPLFQEPKEFDPKGYSDVFLCFAEDVNRDDWIDLIVVGFPGAATDWLENPGQAGGPWPRHLAVPQTGSESPCWTDVDRDGQKELVFLSSEGIAFARPGEDPSQPWPIRPIASPNDPRPGHGLGVGDLNGDGRADVVIPEGWWEAPADAAQVPWPFHAATLGEACAQMCVSDVDGDGDNDVLSSSAHNYGLWWCEQTPLPPASGGLSPANGGRGGWQRHEIDRSISQTHALHLADLNGDGLLDLVTGKRFWAHTAGDPGLDEPAMLCWFELKRQDGQPVWTKHEIDRDSGVGLHFQVVDVNGDDRLDVVTSNKKGVYLFLQERK